jgi:hypothetical protein
MMIKLGGLLQMKKLVLALTSILLLSMVETSVAAIDAKFKPSYIGPTNVTVAPFIAIKVNETSSNDIGFSQGPYLVIKFNIQNQGYDQFPVDPKYFNATQNGIQEGFDPTTYYLDEPLTNFTIGSGQTTSGSLAFRLENNSPAIITYNGPGDFVIHWKKI